MIIGNHNEVIGMKITSVISSIDFTHYDDRTLTCYNSTIEIDTEYLFSSIHSQAP